MEAIRVGVVGLGQVAQIMHIPYLHTLPGYQLTAVCDIAPTLVDNVGELYQVPHRYTDATEMIEKAPIDAVVITSSFDHADIALAAISRGKHVFVEKPLCESPALAREIADAGERAGVTVMVGYMKRYDPGFLHWQSIVEGVSNIKLLRVHDFCHNNNRVVHDAYHLIPAGDVPQDLASAAQRRSEERKRAALGGNPPQHIVNAYGLMLGLGVHDMAILRGSFGDPKAVLFTDIEAKHHGVVISVLDYGRFRCVWEIGNTNTKHFDEEMSVWSDDLIATLCFPSPYLKNAPTEVVVTKTEGERTSTTRTVASYSEAFENELLHFHECVTTGRTPLTDARHAVRDTELLLEIVQRARVGTEAAHSA